MLMSVFACSEDRFSNYNAEDTELYADFTPTITPIDLSSNTNTTDFCFYENNFLNLWASNSEITRASWYRLVNGNEVFISDQDNVSLSSTGEYGVEFLLVNGDTTSRFFVLSHCPISIEFPEVFTPGQGNFQRWRPIEQGIQSWIYTIEDEDGNELFTSTSPSDIGWDGRINGSVNAPSGTYYFSFFGVYKTGRTISKSGSFLLVR